MGKIFAVVMDSGIPTVTSIGRLGFVGPVAFMTQDMALSVADTALMTLIGRDLAAVKYGYDNAETHARLARTRPARDETQAVIELRKGYDAAFDALIGL
jgi:hypothetical protein